MEINSHLLSIKNLTIAYQVGGSMFPAVRDFTLSVETGQTVGLVGESGSGKSTLAFAIMGYFGEQGTILSGEIKINDQQVTKSRLESPAHLWGKDVALVPQNPASSLNPSIRVGEQISEILRLHLGLNRRTAKEHSLDLLNMVRIKDPTRVYRSYPHQLSGGMQQRVMIAMALSTEPSLLILDEPTTNLDVTTQANFLHLLKNLMDKRRTTILYVTHNIGVVAQICSHVAVMYAGESVEFSPTSELFKYSYHPYTQALFQCIPQKKEGSKNIEIVGIPGQIPTIEDILEGCVFAPRCPWRVDRCQDQKPKMESSEEGRFVRCHRWQEISSSVDELKFREPAQKMRVKPPLSNQMPTLAVQDVGVYFGNRFSKRKKVVHAVDGIDLEISDGMILGLVGESGSGKTTLARAIIGLVEQTKGEIKLFGVPLPVGLAKRGRDVLKGLQYVFQNPDQALNPHITIGETLERPLILLAGMSKQGARKEVEDLLRAVKLPVEYANRLPGQLSGGEKQRVGIARAFSIHPDLLIADEPVSALDVSVQAAILNLFQALQIEQENSILFISHDLVVVSYIADKVAVMYAGKIMEIMDVQDLFAPPHHPYTDILLAAVPDTNPDNQMEFNEFEAAQMLDIVYQRGCPFHTRCPLSLGRKCMDETPPWQTTKTGKKIFCHLSLETLS